MVGQWLLRVPVTVAAAVLAGACSHDDAPAAQEAVPTSPVMSPAAPPAPSAETSREPRADTGAEVIGDSTRDALPGQAAASGPPCGDAPMPACPLNAWMKAHSGPAMEARDFGALAAALRQIATFAPPADGFPYWASIARDGADAAQVEDLDATRAACRGCHTQYKEKYKRELRGRPL